MSKEIVPADLPRSTHSGTLSFGDVDIECHVLGDGTRLITQRGVVAALTGGAETGHLDRYLDRIPNKPDDFHAGPTTFRLKSGKQTAHGITDDQFVRIITLYLQADHEGSLHENQEHIAERCRRISYALMRTTIAVMIDRATGYSGVVRQDPLSALEEKYKLFILPAPVEWKICFPEEMYREAARMYGIPWKTRSTGKWGAGFVRRYVYDAIDPDVAAELKRINPDPRFGSNHHLFLTDRAKAILDEHIRRLIRVLKRSRNRAEFRRYFGVEFNTSLAELVLVPPPSPGSKKKIVKI